MATRKPFQNIVLGALVFLAIWLPRAAGLDRFVTPDERKWLARSANFYQALHTHHYAQTLQKGHPGVTIMWAGAAAFAFFYPDYLDHAPGQFDGDRDELGEWLVTQGQRTPLQMLVAARHLVVLANTLVLLAAFFPLRRLLGRRFAVLALLLIASDPFPIALARQLHVDGLLASFTLLALSSLLAWLHAGRASRYLALSGIAMGLAWLTKSPALTLLPAGGFLFLASWLHAHKVPRTARTFLVACLIPGALWAFLALATCVALWPVLWVDPLVALRQVVHEAAEYAEGHVNGNFFLGRITDDPGFLFYPIAYLWRASPATLIGLGAAAVWTRRRQSVFARAEVRRVAAAFVGYVLFFALVLTLWNKMFDRYLLPAFPLLDVVAALGWAGLAQALARRVRRLAGPTVVAAILASVLALQGGLALTHFPYYLTYYNPLVGGTYTAPHVLLVGWGEGLDAAAHWLNQQTDAKKLYVASAYADGPFSYFFDGHPVLLRDLEGIAWLYTDYVVLYVNQWQRQLPSREWVSWFLAQQPIHVVRANGLELARIYTLRDAPLPPFTGMENTHRADFGARIRLDAYHLDRRELRAGEQLSVWLYLQTLSDMTIDYNMLLRLVNAEGIELWRAEGWPCVDPTSNWIVGNFCIHEDRIHIPAHAQPGTYELTITFYDPATFAALPAVAAGASAAADAHVIETIRVFSPNRF